MSDKELNTREIDTEKIRADAKQLFNHDSLLGTIDLLCYAVESANKRIVELNEELDVAYRQRNDAQA